MIPRIVHQTWRDHDLPVDAALPASWQQHNPEWEYRFWTDATLLGFVSTHYPELVGQYTKYPQAVQRADMARYLLMDHFGGVYADLDTSCLTGLERLETQDRVVLCHEPDEHSNICRPFGLERMVFNGVLASTKGHPFWRHVIDVMRRCADASDNSLETTGPLMFTGAVHSYGDPSGLAIHSCHLFTPHTKHGAVSAGPEEGPLSPMRVCEHLWMGSWHGGVAAPRPKKVKTILRRAAFRLTRGTVMSEQSVAHTVDSALLAKPLDQSDFETPPIAVLIPVRDAAPFLEPCLKLLLDLDYPKDRLRIVFCEGDSVDDTPSRLQEIAARYGASFRSFDCLTCSVGSNLDRKSRWKPKLQKKRRSNLARVRNHLIDHGLSEADDWALWLDVDVCHFPRDVLHQLLQVRAKVVAPNCVLEPGGPSFDQNSFVDLGGAQDAKYYKHVHRGLFQPPVDYERRRHLYQVRFLDRVPLTGVGGTMLLVHASIHRAGLTFPKHPYKELLETEAFGQLCRDFGVGATGLPNLEIQHVAS